MNFSELIKQPRLLVDDMRTFMGSKERIQEGLEHMSYLNGIMTAVIVGPEIVRPSEWMPLIVDTFGGQSSIEDAQLAMNMLLLDYNRISASLTMAEQDYKPFLWEDEFGQQIISDWADGIHTGIGLRHNAWRPIFQDDEARAALLPILLFRSESILRSEIEKAGLDEQQLLDAAQEALPKSVQYIHDYWQGRRPEAVRTIRGALKKTGRNEACPCGSGRKYKKCCLN